ncbi:protein-disulfide reductase DsbD [Vreelandella rituensis]|uniref:Thiol:disulfide interchange protein DsbD n=1 Tax=Vreelandella rituensis TaxID=2282306 RepID=A0A368U808_9GAMM|nr:protein-disulfide reductase DsbD [Halomonas rituensis]RCV92616.1 protein-disulfide reductase DsbD [Halomonas rituensis]
MSIVKRFICLLLLFVPLLAQAQWFNSSGGEDDFLPVMQAFQPSAWHDGETLYVGMQSAEGYYLYRHQFAVESLDKAVTLGEPQLPEGNFTTDEFLGDVYVFRDTLVFETPLQDSHSGPFELQLTFQGCADAGLCYPPERTTLQAAQTGAPPAFTDWTPQASSSSAVEPSSPSRDSNSFSPPQSEDGRFSALIHDASLPLALGLFFLAGLGLTFTPCVLPMIPILSSIIVGQNPSRPRAFVLSASYVLGMAFTYALVGVLMGLFGAGLNLQAHLQSAPVLITFGVLFSLFALAMFGAFDLRLSPRLTGRIDAWQNRAQRSGPAGLAVAGALSVLVVSPCVTAPLAGTLVFISSTGDALMGGGVLLALGLGMGVPLLLVGTFGATFLPRSGAWMNGIKITFGILLLGVAIWMVERLLPASLVMLLWAALAIGTALALGALTFNQPQGWPRVRQALGIVLLTWGVVLLVGAAQGGHDPLRPLGSQMAGSLAGNTTTATVEPITVERLDALEQELARAQQQGRPAFVHFTADWCISCKLMERNVYPDPRVAQAMEGYVRINVDVTQTNPVSRELLDHFSLFGPPSLLFFHAGEEIRDARIQGEVNADHLSEHLDNLNTWLAS